VSKRVIVLVVVALGTLAWLSSSSVRRLWTIRNVVIEGGERITADDVQRMIDIGVGDNLFRVDLYAITDRLEQHPWIRSAVTSRRFPDLYIALQERQPFVLVRLPDRGLVWCDRQGYVLEPYVEGEQDRLPTPVVTGLSPTERGGRVGDSKGWEAIRSLLLINLPFLSKLVSIHIYPGEAGVEVTTEKGVRIQLPAVGMHQALRRLQAIWPTLQNRVSLQTVDLRFSGELVYEETQH